MRTHPIRCILNVKQAHPPPLERDPNPLDPNPYCYCGEYTDGESGQVYLRNRYYDPGTGRFTNEDPIRSGANWYAYCGGNPIRYVDPLGLAYYERTGSTSPGDTPAQRWKAGERPEGTSRSRSQGSSSGSNGIGGYGYIGSYYSGGTTYYMGSNGVDYPASEANRRAISGVDSSGGYTHSDGSYTSVAAFSRMFGSANANPSTGGYPSQSEIKEYVYEEIIDSMFGPIVRSINEAQYNFQEWIRTGKNSKEWGYMDDAGWGYGKGLYGNFTILDIPNLNFIDFEQGTGLIGGKNSRAGWDLSGPSVNVSAGLGWDVGGRLIQGGIDINTPLKIANKTLKVRFEGELLSVGSSLQLNKAGKELKFGGGVGVGGYITVSWD